MGLSYGNNESVTTVTEAQVCTIIGLMAAVFFGTITLISTMSTRVLRSETGGVRGEIGGLRAEMNARFDSIHVRFEAVNGQMDGLNRDVQFLMRRDVNSDN